MGEDSTQTSKPELNNGCLVPALGEFLMGCTLICPSLPFLPIQNTV